MLFFKFTSTKKTPTVKSQAFNRLDFFVFLEKSKIKINQKIL